MTTTNQPTRNHIRMNGDQILAALELAGDNGQAFIALLQAQDDRLEAALEECNAATRIRAVLSEMAFDAIDPVDPTQTIAQLLADAQAMLAQEAKIHRDSGEKQVPG